MAATFTGKAVGVDDGTHQAKITFEIAKRWRTEKLNRESVEKQAVPALQPMA